MPYICLVSAKPSNIGCRRGKVAGSEMNLSARCDTNLSAGCEMNLSARCDTNLSAGCEIQA